MKFSEEIPFLDISASYRELQSDLEAAMLRVGSSGWYILGRECQAFEEEFAAYCGAEHAVGVGNGLDALTIALQAMGVGPGDEVLVPAHTFIATWFAVSACGARPIGVDIDPATGNMDPRLLEGKFTARTRAIIPVHLYGCPADMAAIRTWAKKHGLWILEDAAQAHGASVQDRGVGNWGDAGAFSFYPGKNLGCLGDGGAIVTSNADLAHKMRAIRNYGSKVKYQHERLGVNSRLDELQAAVLRVKLQKLDSWNERRRKIAKQYHENISLTLLRVPEAVRPVWHLYVVRHPERARLQEHLQRYGVNTLIHYPIPPHQSGAYAGEGQGPFPVAEEFSQTCLSIPIGPHLEDQAVARVIRAVQSFSQTA